MVRGIASLIYGKVFLCLILAAKDRSSQNHKRDFDVHDRQSKKPHGYFVLTINLYSALAVLVYPKVTLARGETIPSSLENRPKCQTAELNTMKVENI